MVKVLDPGVQAQKFLRSFPPPESKLLPFLTPCGTVGLLDQVVATRCGNYLLVVDVDQAWDLPDRSAVTRQVIGVNDLWNIVFTQKPGQEGLRGLGVAVALQQNFEHKAVLVHCSPAGRRAHARPFCPRRANVGRHRRSYTPDTVGEFKISPVHGAGVATQS